MINNWTCQTWECSSTSVCLFCLSTNKQFHMHMKFCGILNILTRLGRNELRIHLDDREEGNVKLFLQYEDLYDMPYLILQRFAPFINYLDICYNKFMLVLCLAHFDSMQDWAFYFHVMQHSILWICDSLISFKHF